MPSGVILPTSAAKPANRLRNSAPAPGLPICWLPEYATLRVVCPQNQVIARGRLYVCLIQASVSPGNVLT